MGNRYVLLQISFATDTLRYIIPHKTKGSCDPLVFAWTLGGVCYA
jgi:hypothetical protein